MGKSDLIENNVEVRCNTTGNK